MIERNLNYQRDLVDIRDFKFSATFKIPVIPPAASVQNKCSPVKDQGTLGSCTACALCGAVEFLEDINSLHYVDLSRLFVYYNERKADGCPKWDGGSSLRTGTQVLNQLGVCPETEWPYLLEQFAIEPPISCYNDAKDHLITEYHRLKGLVDMKSVISAGLPFAFGMTVYSQMMSDEVEKTGVVTMPTDEDSLEGGHALLMVGYDDNTQLLKFKNSWSVNWGQLGYGTIPYEYVTSGLVSDAWVIVNAELDEFRI